MRRAGGNGSCKLLLFTATAGRAAALAPNTRRCVAGRTRDSAAKPPRRRRVTCRVLDDAIDDLEALGDLGRSTTLPSGPDLDALVAGAGLTVASTAALADAGGAVPRSRRTSPGAPGAPARRSYWRSNGTAIFVRAGYSRPTRVGDANSPRP